MDNLTTAYTEMINRIMKGNANAQDSFQQAYIELMNKEFESVELAKRAIKRRMKSRLIDRYRKNDTINDKAGNLKSYIFDSSAGEIKFKAKKEKYTACLTSKQAEIFELLLSGFSRNDICKMVEIKKAGLSRIISRILEIIKAEKLVDIFQYDQYPQGRPGYNENRIIFHMDNKVFADPDFIQAI